jgi:hypothetical protein
MKVVSNGKSVFMSFNSLVKDKEYDVVTFYKFEDDDYRTISGDFIEFMCDVIPKEAEFYIKIINNNKEEMHWNDYFYSTEELRDKKIETILV